MLPPYSLTSANGDGPSRFQSGRYRYRRKTTADRTGGVSLGDQPCLLGALNVAASILAAIGHFPGKGDSKHKKVVIFLQQTGDTELERAGDLIDELRTMRNRADYDMMDITVETLALAREMVVIAQQAIEHLDRLAADPARQHPAADAIAKYKLKTNTP